ncbi:carbon catabolite repressor protein 4 homolog 3-like [Nymphaea colorata]|nr:carbon catabolite repressor protein 4 homolog 3-like [Nymphaea colorata]
MPSEAFSLCNSRFPLNMAAHRRPKRRRSPTALSCSGVEGPTQEGPSTVKFRKRWTNHERRRIKHSSPQARRWVTNDDLISSASEDRFLMVSHNILGDDNAVKHRDLYPNIPSSFLKWNRRLHLICEELRLWQPDIVCLQEVDRFHDLMNTLNSGGYVGSYKRRTGEAMDGCAMLWKENVFRVLEEESIEFRGFDLRDNVAQLFVFEMKKAKTRRLVVGNIHVLFNPNRGDIKLGQIRMLLQKAHALSQKWGGVPVVLAGDFNSTPQSAIYEFLALSKINITAYDRRCLSGQIGAGPIRRPYVRIDRFPKYDWTEEELTIASGNSKCRILENPLKLCSCYANVQGMRTRGAHGEPLATSYHSKFLGTVDYLWYSDGLVPTRVLDTLPIDLLQQTGGLPSEKIGSDHLALVSEFAFAQDLLSRNCKPVLTKTSGTVEDKWILSSSQQK